MDDYIDGYILLAIFLALFFGCIGLMVFIDWMASQVESSKEK